ncbi:MAG: sulfotransferase family 2 domain-containing protein, partial [Pirellulaceae bacterium]
RFQATVDLSKVSWVRGCGSIPGIGYKMRRFFRFRSNQAAEVLPTAEQPLLLNEAFHEPKQCIFIAIPKTGTTSIRNQLKQSGEFWIPNPHLNILQVRDCIYPYYLRRSLGQNLAFPTEGLVEDSTVRARAKATFESFFKFSLVRNPWARAVSLYFRREGRPLFQEMDFATFCERHFYASDTCKHPTLHRNQWDWLCDESGASLMDLVCKLESIDMGIREIAERTKGRVVLTQLHENRNERSRAASYRDMYNERTRNIIAQRFEKDIDHFQYTFQDG